MQDTGFKIQNNRLPLIWIQGEAKGFCLRLSNNRLLSGRLNPGFLILNAAIIRKELTTRILFSPALPKR